MRSNVALTAVLLLAATTPAFAFNEAGQFFAPDGVTHAATLGASAEGIYFTGAPRYSGLDCSACHTNAPHHIGLQLAADDGALFSEGYRPGQTYELAVSIIYELEGLEYGSATCTEVPSMPGQFTYAQCKNNNFALEIDDATAPLTGAFCAAPPANGTCPAPAADADEIIVAPTSDAVFANHAHSMSMPYELLHNDVTEWHLWWTAPAQGTGAVTVYVATVDGNGGSGTPDCDQDPYGDDVAHAAVTLTEAGAAAPSASGGCSMASHAQPPALALIVAIALTVVRRRARAWLAALVLVGCSGNGPLMTPGQRCLPCHAEGGSARAFSISGTVFPNPASADFAGILGVTVQITDAVGNTASLTTNEAGNFFSDDRSLVAPFAAVVQEGNVVRHMEPTVMTGDCASCHSLPPSGSAEGRVHLPVTQ